MFGVFQIFCKDNLITNNLYVLTLTNCKEIWVKFKLNFRNLINNLFFLESHDKNSKQYKAS